MTIKDIARMANVSTATVSRVINNKHKGNVSTATYNRIIKLLEQTKYVPDAFAAGLRSGLSKTIGIVFPDNVNPYYAQLGSAIEDVCFEAGYTALICNTRQDAVREKKYLRLLSSQRVAGIILCNTGLTYTEIKENIVAEGTRVVLVDEFLEGFEGQVVIGDDVHGGYLGMEYLHNLGHKNILVITGSLALNSSTDRLKGLIKYLKENNLSIPPEYMINAKYSMELAYQQVARIIEEHGLNFSAIFTFNDLMAVGAIKALDNHKIRVPEDISVLGYDNIFIDTLIKPALTTIATPIKELGIQSFRRIVDPDSTNPDSRKTLLQPQVIIRDSCRVV